MLRFGHFLQASAALICLGSTAQAAIITTPTQTLVFGPQRTEFGGLSQAFNFFDSNLGTLDLVTVGTSFGFNSQITVINSATTSSSGSATAEGSLILSAQNGGVNSVLQALLNTSVDPTAYGNYSSTTMDLLGVKRSYGLAPNTSIVLASNVARKPPVLVTDSTPADLLAFEVAGGGLTNLIANTFTQTNLANNGGNTNTTDVTTATAGFSISYTYDNATATPPIVVSTGIPEPAPLAMLGFGMLGAGIFKRLGK